ncbi:MAG: hypothetical protein ACP5T4_03975 [Candidatus Micrarchaeia archaeon]
MHKGIIAYIVILLVLIVLTFIFLHSSKPVFVSPSTITVNSIVIKTSTTSTSTTALPITVIASCMSNLPAVPVPNGNFSTGTFADWNVSGPGFGTAPLNLTLANKNVGYYSAPWSNFGNNTFAATTFEKGLAVQPGNITSAPFQVTEPFLNFKIISPSYSLIYVEILHDGKPAIVVHYNTYAASSSNAQSTFQNASIPLATLLCKNVSIRVVAIATGISTTNFVAVTGFQLSKTPRATPGIVVNETFS